MLIFLPLTVASALPLAVWAAAGTTHIKTIKAIFLKRMRASLHSNLEGNSSVVRGWGVRQTCCNYRRRCWCPHLYLTTLASAPRPICGALSGTPDSFGGGRPQSDQKSLPLRAFLI